MKILETQTVPLAELWFDKREYPRQEINSHRVKRYIALHEEGQTFPNIRVEDVSHLDDDQKPEGKHYRIR